VIDSPSIVPGDEPDWPSEAEQIATRILAIAQNPRAFEPPQSPAIRQLILMVGESARSRAGSAKAGESAKMRAALNGPLRSRNRKIFRDAHFELAIRKAEGREGANLKQVLRSMMHRFRLSLNGMRAGYADGERQSTEGA
jgi:hypothetical protein